MKNVTRTMLVLVSAAASLAFAGSALASYRPLLFVNDVTKNSVTFDLHQSASDDATAQLRLVVAPEFGTNLTQPVGTKLGAVSATAVANGATVKLSGTVTVADPTAHATDACAAGAHAAVWSLNLKSSSGIALSIPVYVDPLLQAPPALSGTQLVACLPASAKLVAATFGVKGVFGAPGAGEFGVTGLFTPYAADGTANAASTVETRALVRQPVSASLRGSVVRSAHRFVLTGSVKEDKTAVSHATVNVYRSTGRGFAFWKRVTTNAKGGFTLGGKLTAGTVSFRAVVAISEREVASTQASASPPVVATTLGSAHVASRVVRLHA